MLHSHLCSTGVAQCHLADVAPSLAGYETTANTLAFATYCLATNPDKAAKLMQVCSLTLCILQTDLHYRWQMSALSQT